jgi:hypothetical protein
MQYCHQDRLQVDRHNMQVRPVQTHLALLACNAVHEQGTLPCKGNFSFELPFVQECVLDKVTDRKNESSKIWQTLKYEFNIMYFWLFSLVFL